MKKIYINIDNLRENHKEFIKINKLELKSEQRFRSEKHNVVTGEIVLTMIKEYSH